MPHRLHLCLIDAETRSLVQVCVCDGHWVWPIQSVAATVRLPSAATTHLAAVSRDARVCCITQPATRDGVWLDWLAICVVPRVDRLTHCTWTSLRGLDPSAAVVPYQATALLWQFAGARGDRACGYFEDPDAATRVTRWIADTLGDDRWCTARCIPFRLMAHEATIAVARPSQTVYFKAARAEPFRDALVTQTIAAVQPGAAARTLAWDRSRGWWLLDRVDGLTTPTRWDVATARRVIDALGTLQRALHASTPALLAAGATAITPAFLEHAHHDLVRAVNGQGAAVPRELEHGLLALHDYLLTDSERTWHHGDLNDGNIAATPERVTFIDHEVAMIGPPFLSVPKLAQTCAALVGPDHDWSSLCLAACAGAAGAGGRIHHHSHPSSAFVHLGAAVVTWATKTLHLRQRQYLGEYSLQLDPLIVRTAHTTAARLRDLPQSV